MEIEDIAYGGMFGILGSFFVFALLGTINYGFLNGDFIFLQPRDCVKIMFICGISGAIGLPLYFYIKEKYP